MTHSAQNPLKVLVVDDSDTFRSALISYLEKQDGIEVVEEAKSAREAFLFARLLAPHLVLMDISMPGLSGLDGAAFIKQSSPSTRVVFVSIHDEETYRNTMRDLHVDGFVSKNNLTRDLPELLRRFKKELT